MPLGLIAIDWVKDKNKTAFVETIKSLWFRKTYFIDMTLGLFKRSTWRYVIWYLCIYFPLVAFFNTFQARLSKACESSCICRCRINYTLCIWQAYYIYHTCYDWLRCGRKALFPVRLKDFADLFKKERKKKDLCCYCRIIVTEVPFEFLFC